MRPLLVIGAGGLLLWYLNSKGYLSSLFGGTTTTVIPPSTTPPVTTPPTPVNPNTLAAIYSRMVADAQAPAAGLSAWGWNYSLARVTSQTPLPPDDPTLAPAWAAQSLDPAQNMSANQFWSVMGPALATAYGLSGLRGLGRSSYYDQRHGGWAV